MEFDAKILARFLLLPPLLLFPPPVQNSKFAPEDIVDMVDMVTLVLFTEDVPTDALGITLKPVDSSFAR
jgi:hypothetical protein